MPLDKAYFNSMRRANRSAVNQAARKFLPADWQNEDQASPHVLALAMWGMEQGWTERVERPRGPGAEDLEQRLGDLVEKKPEVIALLIPVTAEDLERASSPEEAALIVLQAAYDRLMNPPE